MLKIKLNEDNEDNVFPYFMDVQAKQNMTKSQAFFVLFTWNPKRSSGWVLCEQRIYNPGDKKLEESSGADEDAHYWTMWFWRY